MICLFELFFSELFRCTDRVLQGQKPKVLTREVGTTPVIKIITYNPFATICKIPVHFETVCYDMFHDMFVCSLVRT
jgi:hypothetical protein